MGFLSNFLRSRNELKDEFEEFRQDAEGRLDEHDNRLDEHDHRFSQLEQNVEQMLEHFGDYKNRTRKELDLMHDQIETMIESAKNTIQGIEDGHRLKSAKNLLKRLRNNRTRIENEQRAA